MSVYNSFTDSMETILQIALDLNATLDAKDRHARLLETVHRVIPFDAAALLRFDGKNALVPVATHGLTRDTIGRRFILEHHPRLKAVYDSSNPVKFPPDTELPDPFDGLLADPELSRVSIHACLGCPLIVDGAFIGALTADAVDPDSFEAMDQKLLEAIGALAAATLRTSYLIEEIEERASKQGLIARTLMQESYDESHRGRLIGSGPVMEIMRSEIDLVGSSDFNVLITGETGTGKELVARAIHEASRRRKEPFIQVNCAAIPENLVASELFGYEKGAFTGAGGTRAGKFEVADGGTLLLDEVGELPLPVQPQLLRFLQEGEIQRVGADRMKVVNVRVLASTNRDLEAEVSRGNFRADLFHRLNVYPLEILPLRERKEDIPELAGHFCESSRRRLGLGQVRLDKDALDMLQEYSWPGNVRELEHLLMRATLKASAKEGPGGLVVIGPEHLAGDLEAIENTGLFKENLPAAVARIGSEGYRWKSGSLKEGVKSYKKQRILEALEASGKNWAQAADRLGMHRSNLHHLAKRLGLK